MNQIQTIVIAVVLSLAIGFGGITLRKDTNVDIVGTQGTQGIQGEQGGQGVRGEQGIQGEKGTSGDTEGKWMTFCLEGGMMGTDRPWCDSRIEVFVK